MHLCVLLGLLLAAALPATASAQSLSRQAPTESEPRFSLSLERFLSANAVFFSVDDGDGDFKLRSKGLTAGGPIANPLSAPRISFDYLGIGGLTLGVGTAFGLGDLDSEDEGHEVDEGGYNLFMLAPRVGYRFQLASWLDLTPRVGTTLGWASITAGEHQHCDYDYETGEDQCRRAEGDKLKLFGAVVNFEVAAAFRVSQSFNILAGLSYDLLVAAKATEEESDPYLEYDGEDTEEFDDGHLSSLQLWFGLGGYF
jgi:hypothetical protein